MKAFILSLGALFLCVQASENDQDTWVSESQGEDFAWSSFISLKPSSDIYQSCWHCNNLAGCKKWCSGVSACRSVLWTEAWKTCEGYDRAYQKDDLFEDNSRHGANYTYFLKMPTPSNAPMLTIEDNVPPQIIEAVGVQEGQVGVPFVEDLSTNFDDKNFDTLSFIAIGLPKGVKVHANTGEMSGKPKQDGRFKVVVSATDGKSDPVSLPPFWFVVRDENGNLPDPTKDVVDSQAGSTVLLEKPNKKKKHSANLKSKAKPANLKSKAKPANLKSKATPANLKSKAKPANLKSKAKPKKSGKKNKGKKSKQEAEAPAPASLFLEFEPTTTTFLEIGSHIREDALRMFSDAPAPAPAADAPAPAPCPAALL